MRCEGYRKYGSFMTFGPREWVQCENEAIVMLTVKQEKTEELPACPICWQDCIDRDIKIISVRPILANKKDEDNKDGQEQRQKELE